MTLSEKIIMLRKQNGWSQEELADQLDISRQSVSKWESNAAMPDLDKILRLSEIFQVSTDYLLKENMDEVGIPIISDSTTDEESIQEPEKPLRNISLETAEYYMNIVLRSAKPMALAVSLCILSPVCLIILGGFSDSQISLLGFKITENVAVGFGVTILLLMVAVAVAIFVLFGLQLSKYDFMEKEMFSLEIGADALIEQKKLAFAPQFRLCITLGVVLCITAAIPLFLSLILNNRRFMICCIGILLIFVAIAVFLFVWAGMIHDSYNKLLQIEDYTPVKKLVNRHFSSIYWCLVTALYLLISFYTNHWHRTWIIWPVAGILFAVIHNILQVVIENNGCQTLHTSSMFNKKNERR